jgi:hypothetical protein
MKDMVSIRKMRVGSEDAAGLDLLDSGAGDFVRGGKAVV